MQRLRRQPFFIEDKWLEEKMQHGRGRIKAGTAYGFDWVLGYRLGGQRLARVRRVNDFDLAMYKV